MKYKRRMKMRVPRQDQLTYDEIAERKGIKVNKVHEIIKSAYNKMVNHLVDNKGYEIIDSIKYLKGTLRMTEKESIDKLDD
jgi:predicted DNA-binding protein (UPF0251 family)